MNNIKIIIDGYELEVPSDVQLIDALRESGFWVPGLCHHPDLHPDGVCGLCVVEIEGFEKPVLSCMVKPESGMNVKTESEIIRKMRFDALREILACHPHGCLDCDKRFECDRTECEYGKPVYDRCCDYFDDCELRMLTDWMGLPDDTPTCQPMKHAVITEDEIYHRNYNLCISCTRCARACRTFEGRDIYRKYFPSGKFDPSAVKPLTETDCSFCGFCFDSCPTGAICLLDTDYGSLGYFPVGTPGNLKITPPPPSRMMSLDEIDLNQIPESQGRLTLYDIDKKFLESKFCQNIRKSLGEYKLKGEKLLFTMQPYF